MNEQNNQDDPLSAPPNQGGDADCGCADSACCTPESSGSSKIKTISFLIIILAALSVTAYSLFFNKAGQDAEQSAEIKIQPPAFTDATLGEADFLYLVLEGAGSAEAKNPIVLDLVNQAATALEKQKAKVVTASVIPGSALFSAAVEQFQITVLPAVVVAKKGMPPVLLTEEISETSLLKAYVTGGCVPGGACCPDPKASGSAK